MEYSLHVSGTSHLIPSTQHILPSHHTDQKAHRLILYFPVSALVTLFANVLQNPQDSKARTDVRLMNRVVGFLSMLSNDDDGTGGVRRMLGVCAEFERIANVVLDRADQQAAVRRKRKSTDATGGPTATQREKPSGNLQASPGGPPTTLKQHHPMTPRQSVDLGNPVRRLCFPLDHLHLSSLPFHTTTKVLTHHTRTHSLRLQRRREFRRRPSLCESDLVLFLLLLLLIVSFLVQLGQAFASLREEEV